MFTLVVFGFGVGFKSFLSSMDADRNRLFGDPGS